MSSLDLAVRTLFQEFQEAAFRRDQIEKALAREGTYTPKRVKGKIYWYSQRYIRGKIVQTYLGPSTAAQRRQIERARQNRGEKEALIRQLLQDERRRAVMLKRGGLPSLDSHTASILKKLSRHQLVDEKGILIGSHAFQTYSGMLGRLFDQSSLRTLDIDIVREQNVEIHSEENIDLEKLLRDKNFRPAPSLSLKALPSSFIGPKGLRIDLLTPLRGKTRSLLKVPGILHAAAQGLRLLDYLVEEPVRGILIAPGGGIPVTIPHPARFAIHKLMLAIRRPVTEAAKRKKDISQASQLILALKEEQPEELRQAQKEATRRGKKWAAAIRKGIDLLPEEVAKFFQ